MPAEPEERVWTVTVPQQRWLSETSRRFGVTTTALAASLVKHANAQTAEVRGRAA